MDHRIMKSKEVLLNELDKLNQIGSLNPDSLCNMGKIIDGLHHIEEIKMLEDVGEDYYPETYERGYGGREYRRVRRRYDRGYGNDHGYENTGDMHAFLEDSMRKATTEQERERIRRLMEQM